MRKVFVILLVLILFQLSTINCQLSTVYASGPSLSISPPVLEIKANGQEQIRNDFEITNLSDQNINLDIKMIPFVPKGGGREFLNIDLPIKDFVAVEDEAGNIYESLNLRPQENKTLMLHVFVPANLATDDYYFLIAFLPKIDAAGEGISQNELKAFTHVQAGTASNVLLALGKEEEPNLELVSLGHPSIVNNGPVDFTAELKNNGNHFTQAKGKLLITNMFGQPVADLDFGPANILAGGTKIFPIKFTENFLLGPYNAQLEIDNSRIKAQAIFIGAPIKLLLLALAFILFLLLLRKRVRRRFRL